MRIYPHVSGMATNGRYQAAAQPVDLEELKVTEEDEVMEDVEEDEEEEDEEEDAALEDVKDLYDEEGDEDSAGKKRKRPATDDGEQKPKKKVSPQPTNSSHIPIPSNEVLIYRNRWLCNKQRNANLTNLNKTVLRNVKNQVQNQRINRSTHIPA